MKIHIPENIKNHVTNEPGVPLVEKNGVLWYSITQEEKDSLRELVRAIDSIPESEWRTWDESEILKWCNIGNVADRIARNCIVREG